MSITDFKFTILLPKWVYIQYKYKFIVVIVFVGYFCEAAFKVHGSARFHYLLTQVLKRKSLTCDVFKKKKFQENNLVKVREAINDAYRAYSIAAVVQFAESNEFPSKGELRKTTSTTTTVLSKFKEWLSKCSESDVAFQYRSTSFLLYGPLQQMYDTATANGDGYAQEAVCQAQTPIYAQLGFCNYYTEVFRHVVNFLVKWPAATRVLLQKNCCVNLLGKPGHCIELDTYVESELVQPLKNYVSNHTTVNMCERLMANLDMLKYIRIAYMEKDEFDIHHSSRHSVQDPLPDQVKGPWFCVQQAFF